MSHHCKILSSCFNKNFKKLQHLDSKSGIQVRLAVEMWPARWALATDDLSFIELLNNQVLVEARWLYLVLYCSGFLIQPPNTKEIKKLIISSYCSAQIRASLCQTLTLHCFLADFSATSSHPFLEIKLTREGGMPEMFCSERRASCMNISHRWRCVDFLYVTDVVSVWVQVFSQQIVSKVLSNFASIRSFKAYAPGAETICLYWPPTSHAEYFQTWTFSPPVHYARLSF